MHRVAPLGKRVLKAGLFTIDRKRDDTTVLSASPRLCVENVEFGISFWAFLGFEAM
jgi:hypothetical protein